MTGNKTNQHLFIFLLLLLSSAAANTSNSANGYTLSGLVVDPEVPGTYKIVDFIISDSPHPRIM